MKLLQRFLIVESILLTLIGLFRYLSRISLVFARAIVTNLALVPVLHKMDVSHAVVMTLDVALIHSPLSYRCGA